MTLDRLLDAGAIAAFLSLVGYVIKIHIDKRKDTAAVDETTSRTKKNLAELVDELVEHRKEDRAEIDNLQGRVDVLEGQLSIKEETIKQKDSDIERLTLQVSGLRIRLDKVLVYMSHLLRELNERGVQYTQPEPGVLDTDPNIQAVKVAKK